MKVLALGDVVGRSGRDAVIARLPGLREQLALDFVIVNGENAAHGFGITPRICEELYEAGVDVITLGNHAWDQREIIPYIDADPKLLRPLNYPAGTPGRGSGVFAVRGGAKIFVAQVMGRLFMDPLDCPFAAIEREMAKIRLGAPGIDAVIVDVHAETTSEKMAVAHMLDGRVSLVVGTHTHVPTADAQILPHGTAYQSDLGMCGDYNSVIGMVKEFSIARFTRKMPGERMAPADGEATICGVVVETDDASGLAKRIAPLRVGPRLTEAWPD